MEDDNVDLTAELQKVVRFTSVVSVIPEKISKNAISQLIMRQQEVIDFCVCRGKSLMEMSNLMQQPFGMEAMTRSKVFKW